MKLNASIASSLALLAAACAAGAQPAENPAAPSHRYEAALDAASIHETSLAGVIENSLLIGNGDINGLIYAGGQGIQLRLTKNDVWDSRMNTSHDPALATIDVSKHSSVGTGGDPASWGFAYPCPVACAVLDIATAPAGSPWQQCRAEGSLNTFVYDGKTAVMSIQGKAGASCGWACPVTADTKSGEVHLRLSGTPNARYYLTVHGADGSNFESGWKDTPANETDTVLNLPGAMPVSQIVFYTWTKDGAMAQNHLAAFELTGPAGTKSIDLAQVTPPPSSYELDVRRAAVTVPGSVKGNTLSIRAQADRNVFVIEGDAAVSLKPPTAGFIPKAERGSRGGTDYLVQNLPADTGYPETGDWPGMSFVVAKAVRGGRTAVAIVTSLESKAPLDDAIALAENTAAQDGAALRKAHEMIWNAFWDASRIDLSDTYLSDVWYRNLYFMRCVSRPGAMPVGLYAGLVDDSPSWHGDFHLNYNSEQTYWGWYACNHAELSQPYEWLIARDLTRGRWFAGRTYNCDGAFFPYNIFMHEPVDPEKSKSRNNRQMAFIPYTYTLGVAGWAIQNCWLHYKYAPDRKLLETTVYPLLKDVAVFYACIADKCKVNPATGRVILGPSFSPEHWTFGRDDGTCDIAFARMTLKAAIEAAATLGTDRDLANQWGQTLEKLPDYPRTTGTNPVIVDIGGAPPTQYNVPVPALPVYPAGEVTWFSPEAEKNIFAKTISGMSVNGANDAMILAGARARLSIPDAYEWTLNEFRARQTPNGMLTIMPKGGQFNGLGHFTEDFAASGVITEMLLQSVGDILRIFPAWPKDKDASFENLRAQGGFLVSAEQKDGKIAKVSVTSTVGGELRLLDPWTNKIVERKTRPGQVLEFNPSQL